MTNHERFIFNTALDGILLDIATQIELSPYDRRIAESRFRRLKEHLERAGSPLAPYLKQGDCLIYAQGSMATSTTIVSGTNDDRFDIDAIVEIDIPAHWSERRGLDLLEQSLHGFPGVLKIVRCTRCIQLQFASMHMDVTIIDRSRRIAIARAGEILHVPDHGPSSRVPSNPWGFTTWFRSSVGIGASQKSFAEELAKRRALLGKSRLKAFDLYEMEQAKADQVDLPPMIPSMIDAQEAVALKLLKRHIYKRYEKLAAKQPPSIYLAKRAGSVGYVPQGLTAQLIVLAETTSRILRAHVASGTKPDELNPSYAPDRINDRWPADGPSGVRDMTVFADVLDAFADRLRRLSVAPLQEIVEGMAELFGERLGAELKAALKQRFDTRTATLPNLIQDATGSIRSPAIARVTQDLRPVPRHNFHPMRLEDGSDDEV